MESIRDGWLEFSTKALPRDVSMESVKHARRAYYAGANHLFCMLAEIAKAPGENGWRLDVYRQELEDFVAKIEQGRA